MQLIPAVKRNQATYALFFGMTLLFILVSNFGLGLSMPTDKHGMMSNCPFMAKTSSLCDMNAADHIGKWQQLFTSLQISIFLLLLIIASSLIYFFIKMQSDHQTSSSFWYRYYKDKNPELKLYNYLLLALSDGIIHPKLYN